MKKIRNVIAFLVAAFALLFTGSQVFADTTGTITVQNAQPGQSYKLYKLLMQQQVIMVLLLILYQVVNHQILPVKLTLMLILLETLQQNQRLLNQQLEVMSLKLGLRILQVIQLLLKVQLVIHQNFQDYLLVITLLNLHLAQQSQLIVLLHMHTLLIKILMVQTALQKMQMLNQQELVLLLTILLNIMQQTM